MRGILSRAVYLPHHRLDRSTIAGVAMGGGGKGTRTVASFDEDTTTMAVEAGRLALRALGVRPTMLLFATTVPAYLDKANATAAHAALGLDPDAPAFDMIGGTHSAVGALRLGLDGTGTPLVLAADIRIGRPGSADEQAGGDGAAAFVLGSDADGPLQAELLGTASVTEEILERWRSPSEPFSKVWEERFGEVEYTALADRVWKAGLAEAGLAPGDVDVAVVSGLHERAVRAVSRTLAATCTVAGGELRATVGTLGAADPGMLLAAALDQAEPGQVVALLVLADGADLFLFRATGHGVAAPGGTGSEATARKATGSEATGTVAGPTPPPTVAAQAAAGAAVPYGRYLAWRGILSPEPPRRPEPGRVSAPAAARSTAWKYGFVGSRDRSSGTAHLPPARMSMVGGAVDEMDPLPMADRTGTIVTLTVDKLAYSPSPPVVFAVADFDGGGRFPVELTDADADTLRIGDRVEMTFRRLATADGVHNYFWKARPVRA